MSVSQFKIRNFIIVITPCRCYYVLPVLRRGQRCRRLLLNILIKYFKVVRNMNRVQIPQSLTLARPGRSGRHCNQGRKALKTEDLGSTSVNHFPVDSADFYLHFPVYPMWTCKFCLKCFICVGQLVVLVCWISGTRTIHLLFLHFISRYISFTLIHSCSSDLLSVSSRVVSGSSFFFQ